MTARRAVFLVLRRPETLEPEEVQTIQQLGQQHSEVATAIHLTQAFANLVQQRQPEQFDPWLEEAEASRLRPFVRFA